MASPYSRINEDRGIERKYTSLSTLRGRARLAHCEAEDHLWSLAHAQKIVKYNPYRIMQTCAQVGYPGTSLTLERAAHGLHHFIAPARQKTRRSLVYHIFSALFVPIGVLAWLWDELPARSLGSRSSHFWIEGDNPGNHASLRALLVSRHMASSQLCLLRGTCTKESASGSPNFEKVLECGGLVLSSDRLQSSKGALENQREVQYKRRQSHNQCSWRFQSLPPSTLRSRTS